MRVQKRNFICLLICFYLPNDDFFVTPTGTAIIITSIIPIANPIPNPMKHCFEKRPHTLPKTSFRLSLNKIVFYFERHLRA
jgi:hypothetical protein